MDLKEYLILQQSKQANTNESLLLLSLLTGGLFGGVMGGLFGLFSKKKKEELDKDIEEKVGDRKKELGDTATLFGGAKPNDETGQKAVKPINELTPEEQEEQILKTQALMGKMMEGHEDEPEAKKATMLMKQMNACMYDENGELRSPEDRDKFTKELYGNNADATFDTFKKDFDKATKDLSFMQNSELQSQLDLDKITPEDIEKQRNVNKESAKQTHKDLAKAKEDNPDDPPMVNLYRATGASDEEINTVKKDIKIDQAKKQAEQDKAQAEADLANKKAEIIRKNEAGEISDDEKETQLAQAQNEHDDKIKQIDDNLKKSIKDLGGKEPTTTQTTTQTNGDGDSEEMKKLKDDKAKAEEDFETKKTEIENNGDLTDEQKTEQINKAKKDKDDLVEDLDAKIDIQKDYEKAVKDIKDNNDLSDEEKEAKINEEKAKKTKAFEKVDDGATDEEVDDDDDDVKNYTGDEGEEADEELAKSIKDKDGKLKDPKTIWKKRKNKRTGKPTKSYYNKKGDSISKDDMKRLIRSYKKSQGGGTNESYTDLRSYMRLWFN